MHGKVACWFNIVSLYLILLKLRDFPEMTEYEDYHSRQMIPKCLTGLWLSL